MTKSGWHSAMVFCVSSPAASSRFREVVVVVSRGVPSREAGVFLEG